MSATSHNPRSFKRVAIGAVAVSAFMWAFWWYPVRLIEAYGTSGAWTASVMNFAALILCLPLLVLMPGRVSGRAIIGALLIGGAVMLYTVSVSFTDFIRAVLIFYIAPAWSLIIECTFMGRRWTWRALVSILCSLIGLLLISRGEFSTDGVGALGDWMALLAGICWSIGSALVFSARRSDFAWIIVITLIGGIIIGQSTVFVWGDTMGTPPNAEIWQVSVLTVFALCGAYLAFILGCTLWGATLLPPTIMSFLLSVEILGGVIVSALFLGEKVGAIETLGAGFVIGAVLLELTRPLDHTESPPETILE